MFGCLGVALGQAGLGIVTSQLEAALTSSYYAGTIFCLILSLSELPNSMEKSSEQFRNLYNRRLAENCVLTLQPYTMQNRKLLKAMSEIKPVYFTVWGMLRVDKSLLLSIFGCTLTFGILIMQLNRNGN
ncbi:hypothetical protein AVEN_248326-1 [Araneus ventricosus]|uniref:Uncharacterized protein n=1 Tax=Araneus ventricosus TaxID=182803 RepID=A0A4Y2QTD0_ARAVE|nr:hypothetical protein AVEN_201956-1 [Araneus ventricosus]GBN66573.1 hypothetical protein AVEN_248326-1 [Araneus ventricosus]